ncbi:hypothetical protein [Aureimonas sp. AU20]|uniref:hypothetical protein n=1 Tax=Aureimonas sp. AU20 TaxID=1349819 RepID=UPI00071F4740|nr:hypothetical protein [Aureimonas sp. AU20]ALN74501.1 hypothetical protein M673_17360 [Aureimonas sp. AU20]
MRIAQGHLASWPQTPRPAPFPWISSALLIGCLAPLLGHALMALSASIFQENGAIEDAQALLLAFAALGFLNAYRRAGDAKALFCVAMGALSILALQREIPACESAFFEGGLCVPRAAKIPLSGAVALIAGMLALAKRPRWRSFLDLRNLAWVWPVGIAALLLGAAELAEHALHQEMEETLEFGAYAYLATFAIWIARAPAVDKAHRKAVKPETR